MTDQVERRYDLRSDEFRANPYPTWSAMREQDPVYRNPDFQMWFLTRHRDVKALLDAKRFSVDRLSEILADVSPGREAKRDAVHAFLLNWMSLVDAPRHTVLRGLVSKAFTPGTVRQLRPFIQEVVDRHLARVRPLGAANLVADIAYPVPCEVIGHIINVPLEDFETFVEWSDALVAALSLPADLDGAVDRAYAAIVAMKEYFREPVAEALRDPQDDFFSRLVNAEVDGMTISYDELISTLALMLVGGNETSRKLVGNAIVALDAHPDQLERLRREPDLMSGAVEEFIRYDGVAVQFVRTAREDVEFDGVVVPAGSMLFGSVHAANRDPEVFVDPDRLDVTRENRRSHVGLGGGPHFCVGAALGRLETEVVLNAIIQQLPDLRVSADHLEWEASAMHRSAEEVPIRFTPS